MNNIILINIISILGFSGFIISAYIYHKKSGKKKLICPIRSNCDKVVHSKYSTMLGVPLEVLGMVYYIFIGIAYFKISLLGINYIPLMKGLTMLSGASLLFSVYLLFTQIFTLRQWCAWCMASSAISILIFIFSYLNFSLM